MSNSVLRGYNALHFRLRYPWRTESSNDGPARLKPALKLRPHTLCGSHIERLGLALRRHVTKSLSLDLRRDEFSTQKFRTLATFGPCDYSENISRHNALD